MVQVASVVSDANSLADLALHVEGWAQMFSTKNCLRVSVSLRELREGNQIISGARFQLQDVFFKESPVTCSTRTAATTSKVEL